MKNPRLLHTCPVHNAELMAVMLENHGIAATEKPIEPMPEGEDEFSRPVEVYVDEVDYPKAHRLFFEDSEDEL